MRAIPKGLTKVVPSVGIVVYAVNCLVHPSNPMDHLNTLAHLPSPFRNHSPWNRPKVNPNTIPRKISRNKAFNPVTAWNVRA